MLARRHRHHRLLAAVLTLVAPAAAEEVTVQNDSASGGGMVAIQAGFIAHEQAAAWLTSPCDGSIVAVQILWLSQSGQAPPSLEEAIRIRQAGTFPVPGPVLALLEAPVMTDGFLNEFRYLDEAQTIPIDVPVSAGQTFVVAFEFANTPGLDGASVCTDVDGCQTGRNSIYAIPGGWLNACALGVSGDFVIRAVVDCAELSGACCLPDGSCQTLTPSECTAAGGDYQGDLVDCISANCPQPRQACCFEATGGCLNLTAADCLIAGGIPGGVGTDCATYVCFPSGACCLPDGTCQDQLSPDDCAALGGTFMGDGTSCAGVECPEPTGACCFVTGGCLVLTASDCAIAAGDWAGPGTDCADRNGNGRADACEQQTSCAGDTDYSGDVDLADLATLLSHYGQTGGAGWTDGDFDDDGDVDLSDLSALLANYGQVCP